MADEFSQYARTPSRAQAEPDEFAQYARSSNTSGNPNGSNPAQAIGQDIYSSLASFPGALSEMVTQLPGQAVESGKQIYNDPKRAMLNADLGLLEGLRGLINLPSTTFGYLGEKGVPYFKDEDVMALNKSLIRKEETDLEKYLKAQLGAGQEGDELIRGITSFAPAGGFGKTGSGLSKFAGRTGGTAAVAAGQELDPLHAAMIGTLFEGAGKGIGKVNEKVPLAATAIGSGIAAGGHMLGMPDVFTAPVALGAGYIANNAGKILNPNKSAQKEVFHNLSAERIAPIVEASERLGLPFVMPAESSRTNYHGTKAGKYGSTGEALNVYQNKLDMRDTAVKDIISGFMENVSPKKHAELIEQGYKNTNNLPIAQADIVPLLGSEIVMKSIKKAETDPAYKDMLKDTNPGEIGYWKVIKSISQDNAEKAKGPNGHPTSKSRQYSKTADQINEMLKKNTEFAETQRMAELQFLRREFEDVFLPAGKELGAQALGKFLLDDRKFNNAYKHLEGRPELQQALSDFRTVFPNLLHNKKHQTAEFGERASTAKKRESTEVFKDFLKETIGPKHESAIVDLITNPNWPQIFAEYQAKNKPNLATEMMKSMGYQLPVAGYAGQNKNEERE